MEDKLFDMEVMDDERKDLEVIRIYLKDEFFEELLYYIEKEDYALAKDAAKGLYILALEFKLYRLYETLIDIYENLEGEFYKDLLTHYHTMKAEHERLLKEYF